jgi:hypothetical protein
MLRSGALLVGLLLGGPAVADDPDCRCLAGTRQDEGPAQHMALVTNAKACIGSQSSDQAAPRCRIEIECLTSGGGPRCGPTQAVISVLVQQRLATSQPDTSVVTAFHQALNSAYAEHLQQTGNSADLPSTLLTDLHGSRPDVLASCLSSIGGDPRIFEPDGGGGVRCGTHPNGMFILTVPVPGRDLEAVFQISTDG